jgi:hypothetical protein
LGVVDFKAHKSLPTAAWSVPESTNVAAVAATALQGGARGVEKDVAKAFGALFVPWHIVKHAGWNEPHNRYRADDVFWVNK